MIKDALLELLQNTPYEKITVTALCKQSEITRATFYLHYNNIDNVLDELLDDALRLTELDAIQPLPSAISNRSIENEKNIEERNPDPDALLPACQRAASNPKYRILFLDESLSHHMLRKLYQMQKPQRIPEIMRDYHLNEWEVPYTEGHKKTLKPLILVQFLFLNRFPYRLIPAPQLFTEFRIFIHFSYSFCCIRSLTAFPLTYLCCISMFSV